MRGFWAAGLGQGTSRSLCWAARCRCSLVQQSKSCRRPVLLVEGPEGVRPARPYAANSGVLIEIRGESVMGNGVSKAVA
jgi:hypothetical protein